VLASGTLQRCLGITPGQARFAGGPPATAQYCEQLPGAALYNQAGQHYQAGDRAGAAKLATSAAQAGNPLAQLRLAIMYEGGDALTRGDRPTGGRRTREGDH
jgi:TPR repeat protein